MAEADAYTLLAIAGMALITVLTRGFFFISQREWQLPGWVQRGLQYAPIAALAAVIAPDILTTADDGQHLMTALWRDARLYGALACAGFYFWRRGRSHTLPLAIAAGLAVYLPLRLLAGW